MYKDRSQNNIVIKVTHILAGTQHSVFDLRCLCVCACVSVYVKYVICEIGVKVPLIVNLTIFEHWLSVESNGLVSFRQMIDLYYVQQTNPRNSPNCSI